MQIEIVLVGKFKDGTQEQIREHIVKAARIVNNEIERYGFAAKNVRDESGEMIAQVVTH